MTIHCSAWLPRATILAALVIACSSAGSSHGGASSQGGSTSTAGQAASGVGGVANQQAAGASSAGTSALAGSAGTAGASTAGTGASTAGAAGAAGAVAGAAGGGATGSGGAPSAGSGGGTSSGGASGGTPSSGCSAQSPLTGKSIDGMITVGGQQRTYRLSVPTDYVSGETLPLVFVFNGVGGTGAQAQQFFQLETGHRAIFIYPDALPNSTTNGQIAWVFEQNGIDVAYFDALVTYLTQSYCIDTGRIFALGASSGAIMSNMLGCFRGDVLRAIAPSSGMDWKQGGCKGDVAVMVICGTQDSFNPCDDATNGAASETNVWAPQNGCTTQTAPSPISNICVSYQGCRAADPLLLCTHAGGHGWPTSNGDFWWQFFMGLG